jgi:hypothetical protein
MKFVSILGLFIFLPRPALSDGARPGAVRGIVEALAFEENRGQFDRSVRFVSGRGATLRSSSATA